MKKRWVMAAAIAGGLVAAAWLATSGARSRAFWSRSVAFSASYVPPAFTKIVYTEMRYDDGAYRIFEKDRKSGAVRVLSDGDRTALQGVASESAFLYHRVVGNSEGWVWGTGGRREEGRLEDWGLVFSPNITPSGQLSSGVVIDRHALGPFFVPRWIEVRDLRDGSEKSILPRTARGPLTVELWDAAVSPDGSRIAMAYSAQARHFAISILDCESTKRRLLIRSPDVLMRPRWRPDGKTLTIVGHEGSGWSVREIRADGSGLKAIYSTSRFIESAELHPDGRHLLLALDDGPRFEGYFRGLHVYEVDLTTGRMERLDA